MCEGVKEELEKLKIYTRKKGVRKALENCKERQKN
jgi:hypothetical protein